MGRIPKLVPSSIDNKWRVQTPSNVPIERSQRDFRTPPLSLRVTPLFGFGQKRLRTLPHCQTEIMYRYEGSTCPLRKTPFKRPDSTYFLEVFANYISKFGVLFLLGQKLNRFQPCSFLFLDVSKKNACNVGGNNREHLPYILSERAHGVGICFVIFFSMGDDTVNGVPSACA